jgi:biopolymer transport protein ExbD
MYRVPSRRKKKSSFQRPNLIPILDAVFIFIFFLLMSANFIKIYEIPSDVPIISNSPPPKTKKIPLALTMKVTAQKINVYTGVPSTIKKSFKKIDGKYDLSGLHTYLISLKKRYLNEETAIIDPTTNLTYKDLVDIMDATRILKNTDPALFKKDKEGLDVKLKSLFSKIVFNNIQS